MLAPHWWARGLALHERAAGVLPRGPEPPAELLSRWRAGYEPEDGGLTARLADAGLDEAGLLGLLAEPAEGLAARVPRPEWVATVERALREPVAEPSTVPADWPAAFALPLRPLVSDAAARLVERAGALIPARDAELCAVAGSFTAHLNDRLVRVVARTFVLELHERRTAGRLAGADGRERFADFVRQLCAPAALAGLFTRYPVLGRLLGEACRCATDAHVELLRRLASDRAEIVATLLGGVDPGPVMAVEAGRGDAHQHGRTVTLVRFADGRQVVYRPRSVEAHVRLTGLVDRLNQAVPELGLRTVGTVVRLGYGWLEHIPHEPISETVAADRFYRRQGALLALLYALHGSDIHCENLIALGDQPVLVDVETLFHPTLPNAGAPTDPAAAALAASVHRTALLPFVVVGDNGVLDMSGIGGDRDVLTPDNAVDWDEPGTDRMRLARRPRTFTGSQNRPRLDGRDVDPLDHEPALLSGFRLGYDAIVKHRNGFTELLEDCAGLDVRVIVRPTKAYASLMDETTHPDLLRDGLDRDRVLGALWTGSGRDPLLRRLFRYELADLWAGDIPLFLGRPGAEDLWTSDRRRLPGLLAQSGLRGALDKLDAMSEVDRRDQEWIIAGTLATRRDAGAHHDPVVLPGPVSGIAAHPERLLASACAIADQIVARSLSGGGRVNWLGLELVDERQWLVLPMGAGLAHGHVGVALFLAQLAKLSGISRYGEVAREAIAAIPRLFDTLDGRPDLLIAVGRGGLTGLGGIAYGLARLAILLGDAEIREWTRTTIELAGLPSGAPGWADGDAGCLAAMTAVHAELGLAGAALLADRCADRVAEFVLRAPQDALPAGFAHGWAGVGWALSQAGRKQAAALARDRAAAAGDQAGPGWCRGAAGLLIAGVGDTDLPAGRPLLRDLSLCHGELGIAEALTEVAARRAHTALVLGAIERHGPTCGTPGRVSTPGLLTGLAGIGYGLLRAGFSERVPAVQLLQPTPGLVSEEE
jgi:type 2 lantibiotic biosynthesis protein LanM